VSFSLVIPYVGAIVTAVVALGFWQYQLIAKRRYEVVEAALATVGEAAQALHYIRRAEADAKEAAALHPEGLRPYAWLAAHARIQETEAVFRNLGSSSKLVAMHFGDGATTTFTELQNIHREICDAQNSLYFRRPEEKLYPTPEHQANVELWKSTLTASENNDPITQRIDAVERRIKGQFGKYLRPNALRLFIPFWGWNP
jgi:hypothetical protein